VNRFLVVAPAGRDAEVIRQLLAGAHISAVIDSTGQELMDALQSGEGSGAIITDDGLSRLDTQALLKAVAEQPPWSDFPFVLLVRRGEPRLGSKSIEDVINATVLERPLHPASLISATRAAVRARERQRLAAEYLAERERAEDELRELASTLEQKVVERTRDLAAANDRLTAEISERERAEARLVQAQKMEAIGQLTGGIAHDFNNLLTVVVGSLDLALRRCDEPQVVRLMRNAIQAAERGASLTAQLLAFSRRQRLSPVAIDINRVVAGMMDMLKRSIGPHVQVDIDLAPDLWAALADPTQLEVMILNLAINARDAMPDGGNVRIETRNVGSVPASLVSDLKAGNYVSLKVSDDGSGMTPEVLTRAFEPFFTTKDHGKGTGLGLAQLYGFAKQSGGTARIESKLGEGTSVTIYLPRSHADFVEEKVAEESRRKRSSARILLVDDDDAVRSVAAATIEELGYEVVGLGSGEDALKVLERERFDLLMTDIAMPGMTGVELAKRVRERDHGLPILFSSGYADIQSFGNHLSEEIVLKKPFRIADVAARIDSILEGRRQESEKATD
jgi:signal transduction histidine kinase/ActR/RegA family two-component response regulator